MSPDLTHFWRLVLTLAILTAVPAPLIGQELKLTPSLVLKEEYNDNVFLTSGSKQGDFITTLTPSLELTSRTERRDASLAGGINWLSYIRFTNNDSVDYFANGAFGYKVTPRLDFSVGAGYTRNSRPDQIDAATGLSVNSGSGIQSYQVGGSYITTEKSKILMSYGYIQEDFDRADLLSNRQHQASGGLSYTLTPETNIVEMFNFNRQLTDVSTVDNYAATIGLTKRFRELWNFSITAGGRFTHSDLNFTNQLRESNGDWGWVGGLSFNYSGEKMSSTVSFNHDVSLAAGRTGSSERTGGSVTLGDKFTQKLSGSAGLGYFLNKSTQGQFSVQTIDEKTLDINCLVRYEFTKDLALEGSYHYLNINTDYVQTRTQANQNRFMLSLTMRHMLSL